MTESIFNVEDQEKKKGKKKELPEDTIKREALLEIARSPYLKAYFRILIKGYNKSIIDSSKPELIDSKRDSIIQWYAKKDSLERMTVAAVETLQTKEISNKKV